MQNQPTFKEIKNSSNTYLLKRQPLLKISKDTQKCSKFYVRKKKKKHFKTSVLEKTLCFRLTVAAVAAENVLTVNLELFSR